MRTALLIAALLAVASPALAQSAPPAPPPAGEAAPPPAPPAHARHNRFEEANTTHDGKLTLEQAQASGWKQVVKNFAEMDRDHKGYVTKQDLREFRKERRAAREAAKAGQPPAPPAAAPTPAPSGAPPAQPDAGPGHY